MIYLLLVIVMGNGYDTHLARTKGMDECVIAMSEVQKNMKPVAGLDYYMACIKLTPSTEAES